MSKKDSGWQEIIGAVIGVGLAIAAVSLGAVFLVATGIVIVIGVVIAALGIVAVAKARSNR